DGIALDILLHAAYRAMQRGMQKASRFLAISLRQRREGELESRGDGAAVPAAGAPTDISCFDDRGTHAPGGERGGGGKPRVAAAMIATSQSMSDARAG